MKKLFSVLLTLIMLCGFFALPCSAEADNTAWEDTPVIMVSGFGATALIKTDENGTESTAFPFDGGDIKKAIGDNLSHFNKDKPFWFLGEMAAQVIDPIRMNADGTSYYNIRPVYSKAQDTSLAAFMENDAEQYVPYTGSVFLDMHCIADVVGADRVFNFLYDWRLSSDIIADELYAYIKDVLKITGEKKVNLYCLSQGSVCVAQYLYKYADKALIDNLVFDNPIFTGSDLVADVFETGIEEYRIDFTRVLDLVADINHTEVDYKKFAGAVPKVANFVAKFGADNFILPLVKDSPAYLEMLPNERFDATMKSYDFSKELTDTVNKVRLGYMADVAGTLQKAKKHGANISILACSGVTLATGTRTQSDCIVNVTSSCGAYCSNEPFPADYVQKKDTGRYCISPDRTIDLSTGFMPERTWIINELNHGQVEMAERSLSLLMKLLCTHELKDAYSSLEYPQFMQTNDPGNDLHARFLNTNSLLTKGEKTVLEITNTSNKHKMCIDGISVGGAEVSGSTQLPAVLEPGGKMTFEITSAKNTNGAITVKYSESDSLFKLKTKTFAYTVTENYSGVVNNDFERADTAVYGFTAKAMHACCNLFGK